MPDWDGLQRRVAAAYEAERLPTWPDPHPGMAKPEQEEYSRVTEPDRYRIGQARSRVWRDTLAELSGVSVETVEPGIAHVGPATYADRRCVRIRSGAPAMLDLVLLEQDVRLASGEGTLPMVRIAVERPDVLLDSQPDCGCDACDSGSLDLLNAVDEVIRRVVEGPLVVLRGDGWGADWSPVRASSHAHGRGIRRGADHEDAIRLCQRLAAGDAVALPDGIEAFVGRSWL